MVLILAVVVGVIASLIRYRGRAFSRIAAIPLRSAWLALLAVLLQVPLLRAPAGPTQRLAWQQVLFLASYLLLLAFAWRNRRLAGIQLAGLGVICNLVVILANGGFMPITPETLIRINPGTTLEQWPAGLHYGHSKDVILSQAETRLWELADVLVLPPPFPWPTAFSLGDLLIAAGVVVLLLNPKATSEPAGTQLQAS
jgi:Family of unknown function (DUF5317)